MNFGSKKLSDGVEPSGPNFVSAHDETALLHRITSALVVADCRVTGAKIDTLGSEVVDAFFVTDRLGAPLSDDHAHAVRTTVQAAVEAR